MSDKADWADLRPILQDMADRIARIEQFLAASGLQAPGSESMSASAAGSDAVFDSVPASFGAGPVFSVPQPGAIPDDILLLARSGKQIQAIKEYRRRTGAGLKQAKDIIDRAARGY